MAELDDPHPGFVSSASPLPFEAVGRARNLDAFASIGELELSVRSRNALRNARVDTLRELVALNEQDLLKIRCLGRKSVAEIREVLESVGLALGCSLPSVDPASDDVIEAVVEERGASVERGCDAILSPILNAPWEPNLQLRCRARNGLLRSRMVTIGQVLAATDEELLRIPQFGVGSLAEVRAALVNLLGNDVERSRAAIRPTVLRAELSVGAAGAAQPAEEAPPEGLGELVLRVLSSVDAFHRGLLERRYKDGLEFARIGRELKQSRERPRQVMSRLIWRLKRRWGAVAESMVGPLAASLEASGGFVHVSEFVSDEADVEPWMLLLALHLAGHEMVRPWQGVFLYVKGAMAPGVLCNRLRVALSHSDKYRLHLAEIGEICSQRLDWRPSQQTLAWFLALVLLQEVDPDGFVLLDEDVSFEDQVVEYLKKANRPMRLAELVDDFTGPEILERGPAAVTRYQRVLRQKLFRRLADEKEVVRCNTGERIHRACLPFPARLLDHAVQWCFRRIAGSRDARSLVTLFKDLSENHPVPMGLDVQMLGDALLWQTGVVMLSRSRVAHAATWSEKDVMLGDRVEALLRGARSAVHLDAVRTLLGRQRVRCTAATLQGVLELMPSLLPLGEGRYIHVDRVGLSATRRRALVKAVLAALPADGRLVPLRQFVSMFPSNSRREDPIDARTELVVLHALLASDDRFCIEDQRGLSVGRRL
jgi:hypothetical protein